MNRFNFSFPNIILLGLAAYVIIFFFWFFWQASLKSPDLTQRRKLMRNGTLIIDGYFLWVGILTVLAVKGFFEVKTLPPRFGIFVLAFLTVSLILCFLSVKRHLSFLFSIPSHWLIYFQSFRVVVEVVLWLLFLDGLVPKEMTFEGRNFDVLVGLAAPIAGYMVQKKTHYGVGIAFNIFGLVALANIITIVVPAFPSPFQKYATLHLASYFPGITIPALLAPAAMYVHILSIKQLMAKRREQKLTTN
ncbi:MAG TPA: hypothetical protein VGD17_18055 [Chitinophagaceae bacterium]